MSVTPYIMSEEAKTNRLKLAMELREKRVKINSPKNELIRDFRVYYTTLPERALYPYDYQYVEIFYNLLKRKGLMCPTYHHLYITIERTIEDSILSSNPADKRMIYGISTIDYEAFTGENEVGKAKAVFDSIVIGLKDIAKLDKLDNHIIDQTIEEIKIKGLDTGLEHIVTDNGIYLAKVTYLSRSLEEGCPVSLTITEKSTNKSVSVTIGIAIKDSIYFWIDTMTISNGKIKIKSRTSATADLHLKDLPRTMEFNIKEILNG